MDIKEVWQALKYDSGNIDLIKAFRRSMTTLRIERLLGEMEADKARIAELEAQLKTAKRDALQKLADGLEIPPTKEDPFVWGHLHSQIMNEIDALNANTIGTKDEL